MCMYLYQITNYPNCTIAEYGTLPNDAEIIKAEIYARGPVPGKSIKDENAEIPKIVIFYYIT